MIAPMKTQNTTKNSAHLPLLAVLAILTTQQILPLVGFEVATAEHQPQSKILDRLVAANGPVVPNFSKGPLG